MVFLGNIKNDTEKILNEKVEQKRYIVVNKMIFNPDDIDKFFLTREEFLNYNRIN